MLNLINNRLPTLFEGIRLTLIQPIFVGAGFPTIAQYFILISDNLFCLDDDNDLENV